MIRRCRASPSLGISPRTGAIAGPDAGSDYWSIRDNVTISRGNHTFRLGGEASYEKIVHDTLLDNYGVFAFNGSKTGNAYADFLLGLPATMSQDAPIRKLDNGAYFSVYVQDDYRIHPRVTLNLGLRYDVQMPLTDPFNRKLAFVHGAQVAGVAKRAGRAVVPRGPRVGRGIVKTDLNNIAPRLGLAWDLRATAGRRCAARPASSTAASPATSGTPPPTISRSRCASRFRRCSRSPIRTAICPAASVRSRSSTIPANPRFTYPAQVFGLSLDFVWPKTHQANLTVGAAGDATTSASRPRTSMALGRNLPASIDKTTRCSAPARRRRMSTRAGPYQPGVLGAVRVLESIFASDYHALQMSAEKRGARFSAKAYYTFGRAEEDVDYQGGGLPAVQNSNKIDLERGRTSADRRHSFTFSGIYTVDHFGNASPMVKALLNDWTISAIVTLQSGTPMTITSGHRSQLRRPDQRSSRHQRRSQARQRPARAKS